MWCMYMKYVHVKYVHEDIQRKRWKRFENRTNFTCATAENSVGSWVRCSYRGCRSSRSASYRTDTVPRGDRQQSRVQGMACWGHSPSARFCGIFHASCSLLSFSLMQFLAWCLCCAWASETSESWVAWRRTCKWCILEILDHSVLNECLYITLKLS